MSGGVHYASWAGGCLAVYSRLVRVRLPWTW